jgi:hypothetical protein
MAQRKRKNIAIEYIMIIVRKWNRFPIESEGRERKQSHVHAVDDSARIRSEPLKVRDDVAPFRRDWNYTTRAFTMEMGKLEVGIEIERATTTMFAFPRDIFDFLRTICGWALLFQANPSGEVLTLEPHEKRLILRANDAWIARSIAGFNGLLNKPLGFSRFSSLALPLGLSLCFVQIFFKQKFSRFEKSKK